jgi:hypothetical protein
MTQHHDAIIEILNKHDNAIDDAAAEIYSGPKKIAIYAIELALEHIKAKARALRRREIRRDIGLQSVNDDSGKRHTGYGLTDARKRKLLANTQKLFGNDGWLIGNINVQEYTREALLDEAARERRLSGGHIVNAQIYETLAEPMAPGQLVREHWTAKEIAKIRKTIGGDEARV